MKLPKPFRLFNIKTEEDHLYIQYKYDFLSTVYFFICVFIFILGSIRLYESWLLAAINLTYAISGLSLVYYLNLHKERVELVCTLILILSYFFSVSLYILAFPHTLRLSIFYLLLSTALFLKGRQQGVIWMIIMIFSIFAGDLLFHVKIGYSHLDILVSVFSLVCLFFIINSYEQVKEKQASDLKALNASLEQEVYERTMELQTANILLEQEKQNLQTLSVTDQLTGLYNRYKIKELFEYEKSQIDRYKTDLSVIIMDIDYFKVINDTLGHIVGDKILQEMAILLKKSARDSDVVSRWGGEEFLIFSPNVTLDKAMILAESIRQKIQKHEFSHGIHLTVSFGVTCFHPLDTLEKLILRADDALYKAKDAGRDNVKAYPLTQ